MSEEPWKAVAREFGYNPDYTMEEHIKVFKALDHSRARLAAVTVERDYWKARRGSQELDQAKEALALSRAEGAVFLAALEKISTRYGHVPSCGDKGNPFNGKFIRGCNCGRNADEATRIALDALTSSPAPLLEAVRGAMEALEYGYGDERIRALHALRRALGEK